MRSKLAAMTDAPLLSTLEARFRANMARHPNAVWESIAQRLADAPPKLEALAAMEATGGEPDVVALDKHAVIFVDCAPESPAGRRSLCYDREALDARKANKPAGSAWELADAWGARLLAEDEYVALQSFGEFDLKTSSWLATPADVRRRGGALFGDRRFGRVFIYHNGAESYYAARGFRVRVAL